MKISSPEASLTNPPLLCLHARFFLWFFLAPEFLKDRQCTYHSSNFQQLGTCTGVWFDLLLNGGVPVLELHQGDKELEQSARQPVHTPLPTGLSLSPAESPSFLPCIYFG